MMDSNEVKRRIIDASDEDEDLTLRGVFRTGEGEEGINYFLVIATKQYEGEPKMKVRYFALHPDTPENDTWMKNGITMGVSDEVYAGLISAVNAAKNELPEEVCTVKDLSDTLN